MKKFRTCWFEVNKGSSGSRTVIEPIPANNHLMWCYKNLGKKIISVRVGARTFSFSEIEKICT